GLNKSLTLISEALPGEYTLEQGLSPLATEVCASEEKDAMFEIFQGWERELRIYERGVVTNPFLIRDAMSIHLSKVCFMPFMAKCIEFGNQCG
ncbi:hypothetical protein TNCT_148331, partial [Trichonephila clavata]